MKSRLRFGMCVSIPLLVGLCELHTTASDWPMLGRDAARNAVSSEGRPPLDWSVGTIDEKTNRKFDKTSRNIKWLKRLGWMTFGSPVVADGRVYIGTNHHGGHIKNHKSKNRDHLGCLLCFRESDGEFLWHYSATDVETYGFHYMHRGLGSSPLVEGNRLWFVTNRWEVVCLDTAGFHDDEDDGPLQGRWSQLFSIARPRAARVKSMKDDHFKESLEGLKQGLLTNWLRVEFILAGMRLSRNAKVVSVEEGQRWKIAASVGGEQREFELRMVGDNLEAYKTVLPTDKHEADVVWRFDMRKELGVFSFAHVCGNPNLQCSPAAYRNRIYVVTGNGTEQRSNKIPAPDAPSLVCFDKETGKVLWTDASPGKNILRGQFSSPLVIEIDGRAQVIVGQGDGWVRSFDALTGKLIWKFDINAKAAQWYQGSPGTRNSIMRSAVFYKGRVYVGSGRIGENSAGPGRLVCIDPTKTGDISAELAVDAQGRALPHRRFQAVIRKNGEKAIPNPNSGLVWDFTSSDRNENGHLHSAEMFHCTLSRVVVKDDLVIAVDSEGFVSCFDAQTGKRHWVYDMFASVTSSPLIIGDRVYVADEDGDVAIFRLSADPDVAMKKVEGEYQPLAAIGMGDAVNGSPVFANGVLYIASRSYLWAIAAPKDKQARGQPR